MNQGDTVYYAPEVGSPIVASTFYAATVVSVNVQPERGGNGLMITPGNVCLDVPGFGIKHGVTLYLDSNPPKGTGEWATDNQYPPYVQPPFPPAPSPSPPPPAPPPPHRR